MPMHVISETSTGSAGSDIVNGGGDMSVNGSVSNDIANGH
jgi:hypothetical protein